MTEIDSYAQHWFAHTSLRLNGPRSLEWIAECVAAVGNARPGFTTAVAIEARKALLAADRELVHRACAMLAVTGDPSDLPQLEQLTGSGDAWLAGAARAAAFEIKRRTA